MGAVDITATIILTTFTLLLSAIMTDTASDTHKIWVIRTAHDNGLSLALEVKAERDGMLSYSDYWHYDASDSTTRDASFDELVRISHNVKDQIENHHLPVAMIATLFKTSTRYLDLPHKEKSSIRNFNQSLEINSELDWRKSLYGARYPEVGNNGPLHESWETLNIEPPSQIQSQGRSRNRTYNVRYDSE